MGPAARLIAKEESFQIGSLYHGSNGEMCLPGRGDTPARFDCLGAFLWAYRVIAPEDRHQIAKQLFNACYARYGHKRLGKLTWEQSLDLLKGCGL